MTCLCLTFRSLLQTLLKKFDSERSHPQSLAAGQRGTMCAAGAAHRGGAGNQNRLGKQQNSGVERKKFSEINEKEQRFSQKVGNGELKSRNKAQSLVFITVRSKLHEVNPRCNPICYIQNDTLLYLLHSGRRPHKGQEGDSAAGTPGWLAGWLAR